MKLNLGCFNKQLPGFVNVDIREDVKPDVVDSAFTLKKFENNSVEGVYASHMLEHLDYQETQQALSRWFDVLKVGGILRLAVPDLEAVFAHYFYHQDLDVLMHMLYGSQRHDFDFHKNGWDYSRLRRDLLKVGFKDVKKWDPVKAGTVVVYEQADGKFFIADGHQRLGLAKRIKSQDPNQDVFLLGSVLLFPQLFLL